jgi:large subunit ribosomal protein L25
MAEFTVEATVRHELGKNAARRLRQTGRIPAVLYGGNAPPLPVAVNTKQVAAILRSEAGRNTIFTVRITGHEDVPAMVKDWLVDPVKGQLLHVDLQRVAMDVRMRVKVPVHTFGEPVGVKVQGGILETVTREVELECLPGDIPDEIRVDISDLSIGKHLRAGDLPLDPQKIRLVTDPDRVIVHVVALRAEEEAVPVEAALATEGAPAEPEVIRKGKKEVEEEEGEAEERAREKEE